MFLARVVGNVWATRKVPILEGKKLLLIQRADSISGKTYGKTLMALAHTIDAGVGDMVLVMDEGSSASQHLGEKARPIRTFIFAVVDQVKCEGETSYYA